MALPDYFDSLIAYNPDTKELVGSAVFQVFAVDDLARLTPLAVTDPASGVAIASLKSSDIGVLPDFRVAGDPPQVIIKSGAFVTRLTSKFGVLREAGFDAEQITRAAASVPLAEAARDAAIAARNQAQSAVTTEVPAAVAAAAGAAVLEALADVDVLTGLSADEKYLRIAATAGSSRIPSGAKLVSYGDGETTAPHWGLLLSGAHQLTGWPGAADANKRGSTVSNALTNLRTVLRTTPYVPGEAGVLVLRAAGIDVGVAGDDPARKLIYRLAMRATLALLSAGQRIEDTDPKLTYSASGWANLTASAAHSAGTNRYNSSVGAYVEFDAPALPSTLILGGHSGANNAQLQMIDVTAGNAVLGTFDTANTLTSGFTGVVPWDIPASARGHKVRVIRTGGTASMTIDCLVVRAENPPPIVVILNHYLSDYPSVVGATLGNDAAVDAFNVVIRSVAAEFPNAIVADPNPGWVKATDSGTQFVTTVSGMAKLSAAIEAATSVAAVGTAGLTVALADDRYAPKSAVSVSEGPLRWTDSRIGGIVEDPSVVNLTDQTAQWNAAMTLLAQRGGELRMPAGAVGLAGATDPVHVGSVVGEGFDYSQPIAVATANAAPPKFGSVIRALSAMDRLVQLGDNAAGGSVVPGKPGASIRGLSLDGRNLADTVVRTAARRNFIDTCQVYWGAVNGVHFKGQNSYMVGKGVVAQNDRGDCVLIDSYFDHKVLDWELREMGPTGAAVRVKGTVTDVLISRIHTWSGANGVGKPAQGLIVLEAGVGSIHHVNIVDNILEGNIGPELVMSVLTGGTLRGIKYSGQNTFNYDTDGTFPVIRVVGDSAGVGGDINEVVISGNTQVGNNVGGAVFSAFLEYQGILRSSSGWDIGPNASRYVAAHVVGTPPNLPYFGGSNPIVFGSTRQYARWEGRAAFNGGGSVFTIPHGLSRAPRSLTVTPGSADAADAFFASADATNITVTYKTARPAGSGNVALNWAAAI